MYAQIVTFTKIDRPKKAGTRKAKRSRNFNSQTSNVVGDIGSKTDLKSTILIKHS